MVGVFGVPAVHEDDPERAVRAALRLLEGVDGLSRPDGAPLQARAGVDDRRAAGDPRRRPGARRRPRGRRRRQHGAAPRGLGAAGHRRRRRAHPPADAKAPSPTRRCRRSGEGQVAAAGALARRCSRSRAWARPRPAAASRRWSAATASWPSSSSLLRKVVGARKPQMALILGDPGIGKSRLVRELFSFVDTGSEFITWRHGRCVPYGEDRTFWALREVVQAHAGILETHDPETVADLLERVVEDGPGPPLHLRAPAPAGRPGRARRRAGGELRRVAAVLPRGGRPPPAGPGARGPALGGRGAARLRRLRRGQRRRPAAPAGRDGPSHRVRAAPGVRGVGRPGDEDLARPADRRRDQGARLSRSRRWRDAAGSAVELVARRAEGNPFFAEELARLLADSGGEAAFDLAALPQSVQAVIAARIDALSPAAKATLADAAVIGAAFWRGALEALGVDAADRWTRASLELESRQLIRAVRQPLDGGRGGVRVRSRDGARGRLRRGAARGARGQARRLRALAAGQGRRARRAATSRTCSAGTSPPPPSWLARPATSRSPRR